MHDKQEFVAPHHLYTFCVLGTLETREYPKELGSQRIRKGIKGNNIYAGRNTRDIEV